MRPLLSILFVLGLGTAAVAAVEPVRIGYFHGGRTNVIFRTAVSGYFAQAGVDVTLYTADLHDRSIYSLPKSREGLEALSNEAEAKRLKFGKMRGTEIVDAMTRGDVDAGTIGESSFIQSIDEGKPIVAVALLGFDTKEHPGHAIAFRADEVISSTADLKGKVLATRRAGPGDYVFLMEFLRSMGLDKDKSIRVVSQVADDQIEDQLRKKQVDGGYYHLMTVQALDAMGLVRGPYRPLTWVNPEMSQSVLVFRRDFIEKHPDSVQRVVSAYTRRIAYEKTIPEKNADRGWKKATMMRSEFEGMMIPQYALPPRVRPDLLTGMQALLLRYGFVKRADDLGPDIDNEFVDRAMEELKARPVEPYKPAK